MDHLNWVVERFEQAAGANLVSLTAYRSSSDDVRVVQLLVVLQSTDHVALEQVREPLREAARRMRLAPMLLNVNELPNMLDTFPLRALLTRALGEPLYGPPPFTEGHVEAEHVRIRLEQEARELLFRLRHDLVLGPADGHRLKAGLWRTQRGVERILLGLSFLRHQRLLGSDEIWLTGSSDWNLCGETLSALAQIGARRTLVGGRALVEAVLPLLDALVQCVDQLDVGQGVTCPDL